MNITCNSDFEALRTGFGLIFASEMGRRVNRWGLRATPKRMIAQSLERK